MLSLLPDCAQTELEQQADLVNVMLTEQKDGLNRLREVAQQWDQQTDSQLRRISEQQAISSQAMSEYDAESNKQMQMLLNLVNSYQQTRDSFKVSICISLNSISCEYFINLFLASRTD